ncbi:hypothetical protein RA210_U20055 [Rubrivivax sp. A210]|nr:hypothetical protein RA210_U20055 [Rubrivivax sp. A210]
MTMTMSQLSQPSWSISARLMGRKGAGPKRLAQNGRQLPSGLAGSAPAGRAMTGRSLVEADTGGLSQRAPSRWKCGALDSPANGTPDGRREICTFGTFDTGIHVTAVDISKTMI